MLQRETPLSITWVGDIDGYLKLIDQTRLPQRLEYIECRSTASVWNAIRQLQVRGAPAIGVAAAYGVCLAGDALAQVNSAQRLVELDRVLEYFATSRPTAINLCWALDRVRERAGQVSGESTAEEFRRALLDEAHRIHKEDCEICREIGRQGAKLLCDGDGILTHCNTGGLAAAEYGTALSVVFTGQDDGKQLHVFVNETRPLLQGARLTAWELMQREVPSTLICDSAAAQVMKEGRVQSVWVGADRIVANGDTANKIGTYGLALLSRAHTIPFYVAAPASTFDLSLDSGDDIPIEQRGAEEVTRVWGQRTAPEGINVYNPAFDVTPANLITAIVTERGIIRPVDAAQIRRVISPVSNSQQKDR
jgi:methylthioribose-1-phosphate isomerase